MRIKDFMCTLNNNYSRNFTLDQLEEFDDINILNNIEKSYKKGYRKNIKYRLYNEE